MIRRRARGADEVALLVGTLLCLAMACRARAEPAVDCARPASTACYFSFSPEGASGRLNYYASAVPGAASTGPAPSAALIAIHGHPRDGNTTFDAALLAVQRAGRSPDTLVVAPVFQVPDDAAAKCRTAGVPAAREGDLLWACASWMEGAAASNGAHPSSFAALDALVDELAKRWPSLRVVTIAGFSAGAQMVQHSIGFAAPPPSGVTLRYVVSDPGTWLYFDPVRPRPVGVDGAACSGRSECRLKLEKVDADCPDANRWKYGTAAIPAYFKLGPTQARARYAVADISYLEAAHDNEPGRGTAYKALDKSCAAEAQGPYRLQRGLGYSFYDRTLLAPERPRGVTIVPGCAHDVACVFPSEAARAALIGPAPLGQALTRP